MSFWDQLVAELESLGTVIAEWLPRLLVALLVLVIGRWILKWIRTIIEKILNWSFVQRIFDRAGITGALAASDQTAAGITATVAYAYLVVVLWLIVFRIERTHCQGACVGDWSLAARCYIVLRC